MTTVINGTKIAAMMLDTIKDVVSFFEKMFFKKITIATILIGEDPASQIYINNKVKTANNIGIFVRVLRFDEDVMMQNVLSVISHLNKNPDVHAILVQLPLPKHLSIYPILSSISSQKDVDGFTIYNSGILSYNHHLSLVHPCTPGAILFLLKKYLGNLSGVNVVILGRSIIVGKPIFSMLLNENCTVTILHSYSQDLMLECERADVLISAVGKPFFVQRSWVKKGCFLIDVGINRIGNTVIGDVDFDTVCSKVSYITPVPGGVGPITVAMLMKNAVKLALIQNSVTVDHEFFY